MSKNGKTLTRAQRKVLNRNGIADCTDWLYIKQETVDECGAKSAGLNRAKTIVMVVQNVKTGEIKRFNL